MGRYRFQIRNFEASPILSALLNGTDRADCEIEINMLFSTYFDGVRLCHSFLGRWTFTYYCRSEVLGNCNMEVLFVRLCLRGAMDR